MKRQLYSDLRTQSILHPVSITDSPRVSSGALMDITFPWPDLSGLVRWANFDCLLIFVPFSETR